MTITEIKAQKGHLLCINFDNGKNVLLDKDFAAEKGIREGVELTSDQLKTLTEQSDYRRAVSRAVWYIERGSLSKKKLLEKLSKAGIPREICQKAVLRMEELDLINDIAYAERLAEQYLQSGISQREAENKIFLKGIDRAVAKAALQMFEVDPQSQIKLIINKKYRTKLENSENAPKVFAALQRKGFKYSDIKKVLSEYCEQLKNSEEEYGI